MANSKKYEAYKTGHVREKNKILRIQRHLKEHPNDQKCYEDIVRLQTVMGKK